MLSQEDYRAYGSDVCPRCETWDYAPGYMRESKGEVRQYRSCNRCGLSWAAVYRIAGYIRHDEVNEDSATLQAVWCVDLTTMQPLV